MTLPLVYCIISSKRAYNLYNQASQAMFVFRVELFTEFLDFERTRERTWLQ